MVAELVESVFVRQLPGGGGDFFELLANLSCGPGRAVRPIHKPEVFSPCQGKGLATCLVCGVPYAAELFFELRDLYSELFSSFDALRAEAVDSFTVWRSDAAAEVRELRQLVWVEGYFVPSRFSVLLPCCLERQLGEAQKM